MKNILAALILAVALPSVAHAELTDQEMTSCANIGKMSSVIMYGRQMGKSFDMTMGIPERASGSLRQLLTTIVIDAYRYDRNSSDTMRAKAIMEYGDMQYKTCLEVLDEN